MFEHKPFAVISDYLTRLGIAILRVDEREMGKTTGDFYHSTTLDFSNDVESAFAAAEKVIMDTEIALDYMAVARPLSLGRFLIEHRFNLTKIYLDVIDTDEEEDFRWLQANAPGLVISSTVDISGRVLRRDNAGCLAIGQKAAWFEGTAHFVNIVEGGGLYGYSGMIRFAGLMEEALLEEKDTRDIVPRKGLGCASLI